MLALFPAMGICYSASLTLYSQHSCADGEGWRGEGGAADGGGGGGGGGRGSEYHATGNNSHYSNNSGVGIPEQLEMQGVALAGLLKVCGEVAALAAQIREVLGSNSSDGWAPTAAVMSPLVASCLYDAAFNYLWYYRESGRPDLVEPIREITGALKMMAAVWKVGGEFVPCSAPLCLLFQLPSLYFRDCFKNESISTVLTMSVALIDEYLSILEGPEFQAEGGHAAPLF